MQTYMVMAPAVTSLLEYNPAETLCSVTARPVKELAMFLEDQMKKLAYFQTQNSFAKIKR